MGRIEEKFNELKRINKKALITFVTAGDPTLDATGRIVREMEKQGADIIEMGIPYRDPIAEGPVIQKANERALKNSIKIKNIMNQVKELREDVKVPLLYLLYFNCILKYGPELFFSDCKNSGVDGLIIPDLPFEERDEIEDLADKYGVDIISLISPLSENRAEKIVKNAKGFIYCISSLGVTGMRSKFDTDFKKFFSYINSITKVPKAIGFGISNAEQVKQLKNYADGLIVGSAVVNHIESSSNVDEAVSRIGDFVKKLREAMDETKVFTE